MGEASGLSPEQGERHPEQVRPRIYVASLADYVNGTLHGRWIRADQLAEDIHQQIGEMLDKSELLRPEEFAIHDYEGFGPVRIGEYESIETVARIAEGISDHGEAFAHWADYLGTLTDEDQLSRFEDAYLGQWDTERDYAESLVEELGIDAALDDANLPLRGYVTVDLDMLARDLQQDHHFSRGANGVHVFTTH